MKTSVLPAQTITRRVQPCFALNARMSAMSCSARSFLFLPFLTFGPAQPLDVALIEHRRHRLHRFHLAAHLVEQRRLEHSGGAGRRVGVFLEDVPAAEDDVVQPGEIDELVDLRRTVVGALAEADGAHLRERADRLGEALADGEDAGDGGGADGAEADQEDAEFAGGRRDLYR